MDIKRELEIITYKLNENKIANNIIETELERLVKDIKIVLQQNELELQKESVTPNYALKSAIIKYCIKNNKCRLNKDDQNKLRQQLYCINNRVNVSLVNMLKTLNIYYLYLEPNVKDEWKDIILFKDEVTKELYIQKSLNEDDVFERFIDNNKKSKIVPKIK